MGLAHTFCRTAILWLGLSASSPLSGSTQQTSSGEDPDAIVIRLYDADPRPTVPDRAPVVPARLLSEAEAARLLQRLPDLPPEDGSSSFALRSDTALPPRGGVEVQDPFPPLPSSERPPESSSAPLRIERRSPEGDVALAPNLSVTFSKPMVSITTHEELSREAPLIDLSPLPPGSWRWLGSRTLVFQPAGRFPMATVYDVRADSLGERWTFRTPPPRIEVHYPYSDSVVASPVLFIRFDQEIDPGPVLETIRLRADDRSMPLRLATEEEIRSESEVFRLAQESERGRYLAFRPSEPLPSAARVEATVGPGTPSREGPRRTEEVQRFSFQTHGLLGFLGVSCSRGRCLPASPIHFDFSNPLDFRSADESWVRFDPPLPDAEISVRGNELWISGPTKARTTYRVTLAADIRDSYGQVLGEDVVTTLEIAGHAARLVVPGGGFAVLDPEDPFHIEVASINVPEIHVRAFRVSPDEWKTFSSTPWARTDHPSRNYPWPAAFEERIRPRFSADELVQTRIDLAAALEGGAGQLVLDLEPVPPLGPPPIWFPAPTWLQSTGIGLSAFEDDTELRVWCTSLRTGAPLEGVIIDVGSRPGVGASDENGVAVVSADPDAAYVLARLGSDVAFLPRDAFLRPWRDPPRTEGLLWYVADDRGLYRPGEEVHAKGWLRAIDGPDGGDVEPAPRDLTKVSYEVEAGGVEIASGEAAVNEFGGFDLSFAIPGNADLGLAVLQLKSGETAYHRHRFRIQEFRRPEFEVTLERQSGPFFAGDAAAFETQAAYYTGGALADAAVDYDVFALAASYTPPNRGHYTFGVWTSFLESATAYHQARTDGSGRHRLGLELVGASIPMTVNVTAGVEDVNRQRWSSDVELLVHPADRYVGLRSERSFVERGVDIAVESIVTDVDGSAVAGHPVRLRAFRTRWVYREEWKEERIETGACDLVSTSGPQTCSFETPIGGRYLVQARVEDDRGRTNETAISVWVSGGDLPPRRRLQGEEVVLVSDKESYRPGETAEILIVAPFAPAEALVSLRRAGIVRTESLRITGPTETFSFEVEDSFTPNLYVQVDLVGATERTDESGAPLPDRPKKPARASGSILVPIPPVERRLSLTVTPREPIVLPGAKTALDIALVDARGTPVAKAEVFVVVVDEAVLALSDYRLEDPLEVFYPKRPAGVAESHLRDRVVLSSLGQMPSIFRADEVFARSMASLSGAAPPVPFAPQESLRARSDFRALALFAPSVRTDGGGLAAVEVDLPDNLTRYRVMAIATDGGRRFGASESALTARLPLMVRPSPPRFLNYGDRFELPVVLENQTDAPMAIDVAVDGRNMRLLEGRGWRIAVPSRDRAEVRFPAAAAQPGEARFRIIASAAGLEDASDFTLPVWTPATTEAFATYGVIDEGGVLQPVRPPPGVAAEFGGLVVGTSSTALQSLTDAFLYLARYPFECSEQIASRILALIALRDVLAAFDAPGLPEPDELEARLEEDIDALSRLQNRDGGFPFWRAGEYSWPFLSVHAAHALVRARNAGLPVPEEVLRQSRSYLRDIETRIHRSYGADVRRALIAYSIYVLYREGAATSGRALRLIDEAGGVAALPLEALGWLLPSLGSDPSHSSLVAEVLRQLNNRVVETSGAAHFATSYQNGAYLLLESDRRADAVLLEALIESAPESELIPKLVEGLLAHKQAGRWNGTQENVFALLALDRYFRAFESSSPDFTARVWLGDGLAAEQTFQGRTAARHRVEVPMTFLSTLERETNLVLSKTGPGRLYYRIGLRYAPVDLELDALERGFTVERRYEPVDSPDDVTRLADGTWRIRAGALVRAVCTFLAPTRRYHVALVDPLAAGLEALNPALEATGRLDFPRQSGDSERWWWRPGWFEHQNLRDDRAEAFTSLLGEGVHEYSYLVRATTPGDFVVPPARVEEMYRPETFGRSATDRVQIR